MSASIEKKQTHRKKLLCAATFKEGPVLIFKPDNLAQSLSIYNGDELADQMKSFCHRKM